MCEDCVQVKDKAMTYTKCKQCSHWRKMSKEEVEVAKKPYRMNGSGQMTRNY